MNIILGTWWNNAHAPHPVDDTIVINFREKTIKRFRNTQCFGPVSHKIATCILVGQYVPYSDLVNYIYGDREDGGPLEYGETIRVLLVKTRRQLRRLKLEIVNRCHIGYEIKDVA